MDVDRKGERLPYFQADAAERHRRFPDFLTMLKERVKEGRPEEAATWAMQAVSPQLDYSSLLSLRKVILQRRSSSNQPLRLAVVGGATTTQLVQLMEVFLAASGVEVAFWEGEYGVFRQAVLLPDRGLDTFGPHLVFFATSARDLGAFPEMDMTAEAVEEFARVELSGWLGLWGKAHERWGAQVIQNTFNIAPWTAAGHLAIRVPASRERYTDLLNWLLVRHAPDYVLLHDLRNLATQVGAHGWFEPRFYYDAKMPCGPEALVVYAHSVSAVVRAVGGSSKKVLVLDLDNTIWGGVVGDDGVGEIRIGQGSAEGESFLAFQQYVKELAARGVLLAVCSKNDMENALEPFRRLPEMVLGRDDFSAFVANWGNKADNLREISKQLRLGLDAFVFVDDSPSERALVRRFVPEVAVPDMPEDPANYVEALACHRYFEVIAVTPEDLKRPEYYRENRRRRELEASKTDVASFLRSLNMRSMVEPVTKVNCVRATQLINKSNQFNLTARRYAPAEVEWMSESPDWVTLTFTLSDDCGDNGLIAVLLLCHEGNALRIDTWVMSCRVLMRGMESLVLNCLTLIARRRRCDELVGEYVSTAKNGLVRDHYKMLGFELEAGRDGASAVWRRSMGSEDEPLDTFVRAELSASLGC